MLDLKDIQTRCVEAERQIQAAEANNNFNASLRTKGGFPAPDHYVSREIKAYAADVRALLNEIDELKCPRRADDEDRNETK